MHRYFSNLVFLYFLELLRGETWILFHFLPKVSTEGANRFKKRMAKFVHAKLSGIVVVLLNVTGLFRFDYVARRLRRESTILLHAKTVLSNLRNWHGTRVFHLRQKQLAMHHSWILKITMRVSFLIFSGYVHAHINPFDVYCREEHYWRKNSLATLTTLSVSTVNSPKC